MGGPSSVQMGHVAQEARPGPSAGYISVDGLGMTLCLVPWLRHLACPVFPRVHILWLIPYHHHQPPRTHKLPQNYRFLPSPGRCQVSSRATPAPQLQAPPGQAQQQTQAQTRILFHPYPHPSSNPKPNPNSNQLLPQPKPHLNSGQPLPQLKFYLELRA